MIDIGCFAFGLFPAIVTLLLGFAIGHEWSKR